LNYSNSEKINDYVPWEFFTLVTVNSQLLPTETLKKSNTTHYNYKHVRFSTRSLEKGSGSVLAAFCHSYHHTGKLLGVIDTSLTDYRNQHTFWFSFKKKRLFQLTAKKPEGKHTAQVLGAAPLFLTNSDSGRLSVT